MPHIAEAIDHKEVIARVIELEDFAIIIRTNWKALVTVASSLSILIGWLLTHYGASVAHAFGKVARL